MGATVNAASVALALRPNTPRYLGGTSASVRSGGALVACTLLRPLTAQAAAWSTFEVQCAYSTLIANVSARYQRGEALTLAAEYTVDASALGIDLARTGTIERTASRADVQALLGRPTAAYVPSPRRPEGAAACDGLDSAERVARSSASAAVEATVGAVRFAIDEAGVPLGASWRQSR